jgi:hypothetical protein
MSLAALPTELDTSIIEHLHDTQDRAALCAMSLVFRYYHALAEPFFYRTIAIQDKVEVRVKRLMMTFLDRKRLAHYVTNIAIAAPSFAQCSEEELRNIEIAQRRYVMKVERVMRTVDPDKEARRM